jgi:hypothetical protein
MSFAAMPPQQKEPLHHHHEDDESDQQDHNMQQHGGTSRMRRVISEAEISVSNSHDQRSSRSSREYRLRKSSLIG